MSDQDPYSDNGKTALKGCLVAIALFLLLVAAGGYLIWSKKDDIVTGITKAMEQPAHGKKEYIDRHYGDLLRSLDAAAASANSIFTFGAAVEGMNLPEEVLYIGTEKGDDKTAIVKRYTWSSRSVFTMHDYGSGSLGNTDTTKTIMVYQNEIPRDYMDRFVVYIEYKGEITPAP